MEYDHKSNKALYRAIGFPFKPRYKYLVIFTLKNDIEFEGGEIIGRGEDVGIVVKLYPGEADLLEELSGAKIYELSASIPAWIPVSISKFCMPFAYVWERIRLW